MKVMNHPYTIIAICRSHVARTRLTLTMLFIALCSLPSATYGQVEIFGYFEPEYSGLYLDDAYYQSSYGKLRLDLSSTEIKNVRFGADIIYLNFFGKTNWDILAFLPDSIRNTVPPEMQPFYQISFRDTLYLDNAYARVSMRRLAIMIGKQQISFGTGYFSNPTDVFNTKNALDPTYEQPGHNAARIEFYPIPRLTVTGLVSPIASDWTTSGKLGRIKIGLGHFDISALGYQFMHTSTDFYTFQQTVEERTVIGGDIVGELLGLGVWGEGIYNIMETSADNSYELLVGGDYTFEGGFYAMCEYHRNSGAENDYHNYDLNDWMRYITGESKTIAQDQLYGLVQYPVTDYVTIGSMGIFSITDRGAVIIPMVNSSMYQNVDIMLMFNLYVGPEGAAYSGSLGTGGLIRATVYF